MVTSCGKGAGSPATGGSPDTLRREAPACLGMYVTVDAQAPPDWGE